MPQVIVVPETDDFKHDVSHESIVWISEKLGTPNLKGRGVRYLAPFWITEKFRGVNRVYHISDFYPLENGVTEIVLGNSFVVEIPWDNMGQVRKFEYHSLDEFGLEEIEDAILRKKKIA